MAVRALFDISSRRARARYLINEGVKNTAVHFPTRSLHTTSVVFTKGADSAFRKGPRKDSGVPPSLLSYTAHKVL